MKNTAQTSHKIQIEQNQYSNMTTSTLRKNTNAWKKIEAYLYRVKQEQGLAAAQKIMGRGMKTKPKSGDPEYEIKLEMYNIVKNIESNRIGQVLREIKAELGKY
jgi:DNA/RNA endonuclease G (NUC1)